MMTGGGGAVTALGLAATIASIALIFRLTATAIGNDRLAAAGIIIVMLVCSLIAYGVVMDATGIRLI